MFIHIFKYAFKTLFRDKMLIFWTFAFPIILGTLFNMAFSNIENSEKMDIINIAIVENEDLKSNEFIKEAFDNLSDKENEDSLFETKYTTKEEANTLLQDDKISGYIILEDDKANVVVKSNGANETVIKYVTEEILQTGKIVDEIAKKKVEEQITSGNFMVDYEKIYEEVSKIVEKDDTKLKNISNSNLSYTMIEFYTLIAMTCLYGGILSMVVVNHNMANMESVGKRVATAPLHKGKLIISSLCASYITQIIGLAILFAYTIFALKVDYGTNLPLVILLALVGSLAGLSLGVAIATLIKANDKAKTGILIAVTMFGCFLSGMMGITMKYVIDKNVPIVNMLNPASMITDGFYALYYYDTFNRYFFNIASLLIFSFVMIFISIRGLRRQKYDSI